MYQTFQIHENSKKKQAVGFPASNAHSEKCVTARKFCALEKTSFSVHFGINISIHQSDKMHGVAQGRTVNSFNASCSKSLLLEEFGAILV